MFFLFSPVVLSANEPSVSFSSYVNNNGTITLPADFRSAWVHLGTRVVTSQLAAGVRLNNTAPTSGLHDVYTQQDSLKAYNNGGKWPDGTILVMEVMEIKWDDLSTGHVIYAGDVLQWFVMIKDTKGRFTGNKNWGNGWGWALFKADNPAKNVSVDYRKDCLGCHEPAKNTDLIFIDGYPTLR